MRPHFHINIISPTSIIGTLMKLFFALSVAFFVFQARAEPPSFTRSNSTTLAFFDHEYKHDDKYIPKWNEYLGKDRLEYENGFDAGLTFALKRFPDLGTDNEVKAKLKEIAQMDKTY